MSLKILHSIPLYPRISNFMHSAIPSGQAHTLQLHLAHEQPWSQPSVLYMDFKNTYTDHNLCFGHPQFSYPVLTTRVCDHYVHFSNTASCYSTFGSPRYLAGIWKFKIIYEGTESTLLSSTLFLGGCHLVISMLNILTSLVTGFYYFFIYYFVCFFRSWWIVDCHQHNILPAKLCLQLYLSDSAQFSSATGT